MQINNSVANIRSAFAANDTISAGLKTFTLALVKPATEKVGWEFGQNEDYLTGQLRALLIRMAGGAGHEG